VLDGQNINGQKSSEEGLNLKKKDKGTSSSKQTRPAITLQTRVGRVDGVMSRRKGNDSEGAQAKYPRWKKKGKKGKGDLYLGGAESHTMAGKPQHRTSCIKPSTP